MGAIYKCRDRELDRLVAVKSMINAQDQDAFKRSLQEARTLASLSHPNIIQVFDIIAVQHQVWMITEWIQGKTLREVSLPLNPVATAAVMLQLYHGLAAAHRMKIFHRDIKPENLMITETGRVILLDFGVAFSPGTSSGQTIAGSFRYSDPALLEGAAPDQMSDLYSSALLMFELLSGQPMLPDLAPLPLYHYIRERFADHLEKCSDGLYPPLVKLGRLQTTERDKLKALSMDDQPLASFLADEMQQVFVKATNRTPERYLSLCIHSKNPDMSAHSRLFLEANQAVNDQGLSVRERAQWFAFRETFTTQFPDLARSNTQAHRKIIQKTSARILSPLMQVQRRFEEWFTVRKWILSLAIAVVVVATFGYVEVQRQEASVKEAALNVPVALPPQVAVAIETPSATAIPLKASPQPAVAKVQKPVVVRKPVRIPPRPNVQPSVATSPASVAIDTSELIPVQLIANAWAYVYVDGSMVGRLPSAQPIMLKAGAHALRLESPFVEPLEATIQVARGETQKLRFSLNPRSHSLVVHLKKPGRLVVDGVDFGVVSEHEVNVAFGMRTFVVEREGKKRTKKQVAIGPQSPNVLSLE